MARMNIVKRPWGEYQIIFEQLNCKIKKIILLPKQKISLQLHKHRSEVWQIIQGTANVFVGDNLIVLEKQEVNEGSVVTIPKNTLHRLENLGDEELHIIEIQYGDYINEDDIKRFDDDYGRV